MKINDKLIFMNGPLILVLYFYLLFTKINGMFTLIYGDFHINFFMRKSPNNIIDNNIAAANNKRF